MKRESESLEKWKENLTTMLGEISTKIDKMEESRLATLLKILDRRLKLGRFSSAALAVIGTLLLIFAALGAFHA